MATIWLYHKINIVTVTIYIENRFAINIENNLPFPSSKNNNMLIDIAIFVAIHKFDCNNINMIAIKIHIVI